MSMGIKKSSIVQFALGAVPPSSPRNWDFTCKHRLIVSKCLFLTLVTQRQLMRGSRFGTTKQSKLFAD